MMTMSAEKALLVIANIFIGEDKKLNARIG